MYIVINEDRHCDVGVYLYASKDLAIKKAHSIAMVSCRNLEDIKEEPLKNCILYLVYSYSDDCVTVKEIEFLDNE